MKIWVWDLAIGLNKIAIQNALQGCGYFNNTPNILKPHLSLQISIQLSICGGNLKNIS